LDGPFSKWGDSINKPLLPLGSETAIPPPQHRHHPVRNHPRSHRRAPGTCRMRIASTVWRKAEKLSSF
jgi:hypothetical protein